MNTAFDIAGVGLSNYQRALDILAHNVTNLNTTGFKRTDVRFSDILAASAGEPRPAAGARLTPHTVMSVQGEMQQTGGALDLAIDGLGFIELMGDHGESVLWRGGHLRLNEDGYLTADNGLTLRAMINLPYDSAELEIAEDGRVLSRDGTGETREIGHIDLVRVMDDGALTARSGGYYTLEPGTRLVDVQPGEDGAGLLRHGYVERSNVDLSAEMIELMIIQRAYTANAQVVQAADQLASITNNLRR
ncbi:flagellar hook-basal body protein [Maricaulis sp. D1M11]|uniref:flagellar hook-basal body protein n=1 Tax=Maricaulis sp. D1M11 TaxID=3076117 RepID=UPI0039B67390